MSSENNMTRNIYHTNNSSLKAYDGFAVLSAEIPSNSAIGDYSDKGYTGYVLYGNIKVTSSALTYTSTKNWTRYEKGYAVENGYIEKITDKQITPINPNIQPVTPSN